LLACNGVMHTARDLMQPNAVTVPAHEPLLEVLHLLVVAGIGGVPVVGPRGEVVGVLSASDVLRAIEQACDEDSDASERDGLRDSLQMLTAGDIATPEAIWVSPTTTAAQVSEIMRAQGIHRVLVGSNERLEGILTSFDLLRAV
jgi:CBS domain-containing protein